jgi:hypothetical protein
MIPFFREVVCFLFCDEKFLSKRAELFPAGKDSRALDENAKKVR